MGTLTHDKNSTSGEQPFTSQDLLFEERLNLRNSGAYVIDPRLLTLTLGGSFGLSQERFTSFLRRQHPDELQHALGIRHAGKRAHGAAPLVDRVREPEPVQHFPGAVRSHQHHEREPRGDPLCEGALHSFHVQCSTRPAGPGGTGIQRRLAPGGGEGVARYEGQRGWADSEIDLVFEYVDDKDLVFPSLSFQSQEAQVNYGLDFGEDLNWHWASRLRYYNRTENTPITMWTVDETLIVDHTETLRSDYRYFLVRTENASGANTTQTGRASLQHRLYESLTTTASLDGVLQTFPQGEKDSIRGTLAWVYTKRLPLGGRLTAAVGGSEQYENDRFNTGQGVRVPKRRTPPRRRSRFPSPSTIRSWSPRRWW